MEQTFSYSRNIPISTGYDLLVAGGGPAGSAAAICGARLGLRVLLAEATGCLGGMGTSGLVTTFGPMSDGVRPLVGGFARELVETLHKNGQLGPHVDETFWTRQLNRWIPFKPEGLKRQLDRLAVDAGVDILFNTRVVDCDVEGHRLRGAVVHNIEGLQYVPARTFVDATGDAVLSAIAGVECRIAGVHWDFAPGTLCSLFSGVNWRDPAYGNDTGDDAMRDLVTAKLLPRALEDGHFSQIDRFLPGMNKIGSDVGSLNGGHVFGLDGLNTKALSNGLVFGRRLATEYESFFRKYVPGCENIELLLTAPLMGVRDTRRIVGEFELTIEHFLARRQFPDQIAVYNRPTDVHPKNTSKEEFDRFTKDFEEDGALARGHSVGIPYSILVPRGWENIWVAGRCHSSDTKVHGSIRAQSAAYMMGEAAATAAAQSLATGEPACDLDTKRLVTTLRERGAYLPQTLLSPTMTRT